MQKCIISSDGAPPASSNQHGSDFVRECELLGAASAAAKLRLDEKAPDAYRRAFVAYTGPKKFPSYFTRKWLSLRLSAVKRGMVVDANVTPTFLEHITGNSCPVTLEKLDRDGKSAQNPSVDRLVNEVSYLAGNICVLSLRANRAKGDKTFEEVAQLAEAGKQEGGLEPVEWMRLASLMYGAWSRAFKCADPYLLPLAAMPSPKMFMSTSQVVQLLLTRLCYQDDDDKTATARWVSLTREGGGTEEQFMTLRHALAAALASEDYPGNAWLHGDVFEVFVEWFNSCHRSIIPAVEALLQEHQQQFGEAIIAPEWPTTGRYHY